MNENFPEVVPESELYPALPQGNQREPWQGSKPPIDPGTVNRANDRRIGGLRPLVFWSIVALIGLVVVGSSVGGAIGGTRHSSSNNDNSQSSTVLSSSSVVFASKSSTTIASSTSSSTSQASSSPTPVVTTASSSTSQASPSPTPVVTTDCPNSNGTVYTPGDPSGGGGRYEFTKRCGADTDGSNLVEAFVTDFDNCIALCSNWNYWTSALSGVQCTSASFLLSGSPPGNCWAKNGTNFVSSSLVAAALLLV